MKTQIPREDIEQIMLTDWLTMNGYLFSAIRNESDYRSFYKGKKRHASGVRKGIPDFCILLKRKSLLFIELKRRRPILKSGKLGTPINKPSPEQEEWIRRLNEIENVHSQVCYGAEEAMSFIKHIEKM